MARPTRYVHAVYQSTAVRVQSTVKFLKSNGVFAFSDTASLLTPGMESVQDIFRLITMIFSSFHSGIVLYLH